jgi:glutathione synthase/RimK-type ligase-like ATP-grasp enzyme
MNKICILTKNPQTYFIKRLRGLLGEELHCLNPWENEGVLSSFEQILVRTTGVYGSDLDLELLSQLDHQKIVNNLSSLKVFRGKDTQYDFFQASHIPLLSWMKIEGKSSQELKYFLHGLKESSLLVKPLRGQGGWGIKVLHKDEVERWWDGQNQIGDFSYLAQPYIHRPFECRCFFILDDFHLSLKRIPSNGVSANFTQEGMAEMMDTPNELLEVWSKIRSLTGIKYGAMDCIWVDGQWVVLEVNAVPGIEQLEKVSGVDVAQEILNRLLTY